MIHTMTRTINIPHTVALILSKTAPEHVEAQMSGTADVSPRAARLYAVRAHTDRHLTAAGLGFDAAPWLRLAEDLAELLDGGPIEGEDAETFARIVSEHLAAAEWNAAQLLPTPSDDPDTALRHIERVYIRAANQRFVRALTAA